MVSLAGVEQQQRVPGRRGIEHDERLLAAGNLAGERPEYRDLLGAGRAQIFFEQRSARFIHVAPGRLHHMSRVGLRLGCRINPPDRQLRLRVTQSVGHVRGGIGRREMHGKPALGQGDRDGSRERRLADTTLAHRHDDAVPALCDFIDEIRERFQCRQLQFGEAGGWSKLRRFTLKQRPQPVDAEDVPWAQRIGKYRQASQQLHIFRESSLSSALQRQRQVVGPVGGVEDPVDDKYLVTDIECSQFTRSSRCLAQRRALRSAHQNHRRARPIRQHAHRGLIDFPLFLQSGQRSEAGGAAGVRFQKLAPGFRQAHEPQGVAGWRRVENHMIVFERLPPVAQSAP